MSLFRECPVRGVWIMGADSMYSPSHMAKLHEVCVSPKLMVEFPLGSHNDTHCEPGYFDAILDFIKKVKRGEPLDQEKIRVESTSSSSSSGSSSSSSVSGGSSAATTTTTS
jgi:hypothetical protein